MNDIGRMMVIGGAMLLLVGAIFLIGGKFGLGRLPGDFVFRRGNMSCFFPLASSILASIVLTLLMWLFRSRG